VTIEPSDLAGRPGKSPHFGDFAVLWGTDYRSG